MFSCPGKPGREIRLTSLFVGLCRALPMGDGSCAFDILAMDDLRVFAFHDYGMRFDEAGNFGNCAPVASFSALSNDQRLFFAKRHNGLKAATADTLAGQIADHGLRAMQPDPLVIPVRADRVGMAVVRTSWENRLLRSRMNERSPDMTWMFCMVALPKLPPSTDPPTSPEHALSPRAASKITEFFMCPRPIISPSHIHRTR